MLVDVGQIHVTLDFKGDRGISFPQRQPTIASYDNKERVCRRKTSTDDLSSYNPEIDERGSSMKSKKFAAPRIDQKADPSTESTYDCGFTDEEIRSSFEFLDLDKHNFIGAAELRHILLCMGELVTDEEIDMMISKLDDNGDGEVNLDEFMAMVIDPDP